MFYRDGSAGFQVPVALHLISRGATFTNDDVNLIKNKELRGRIIPNELKEVMANYLANKDQIDLILKQTRRNFNQIASQAESNDAHDLAALMSFVEKEKTSDDNEVGAFIELVSQRRLPITMKYLIGDNKAARLINKKRFISFFGVPEFKEKIARNIEKNYGKQLSNPFNSAVKSIVVNRK